MGKLSQFFLTGHAFDFLRIIRYITVCGDAPTGNLWRYSMKLITLIENTTCSTALSCEHGLSLYIEASGQKILFDMGQSDAFARNADVLGIPLDAVDYAVLSHGHYDHGGGMARFLEINAHAPVYVNQHAFEPHFNASGKDIGLDRALPKERIRFVGEAVALGPGITLHTVPFPPTDTAGMTTADGQPEDFRHEQYLLVEEAGKRILISGCSHKGIVAIAEYFRPDILIGGFHFMKTTDETILRSAADALLALNCTCYTGHCTGEEQYAFLKAILGSRLHKITTGTVLTL